jgi:hypothetical protein
VCAEVRTRDGEKRVCDDRSVKTVALDVWQEVTMITFVYVEQKQRGPRDHLETCEQKDPVYEYK